MTFVCQLLVCAVIEAFEGRPAQAYAQALREGWQRVAWGKEKRWLCPRCAKV